MKTPHRRFGILASLALATALASALVVLAGEDARAQSTKDPIRWSAAVESPASAVRPGDAVRVRLTATLDPGWHLYSLTQPPGGPVPTRISLAEGQPFHLGGEIESGVPRLAFDPFFQSPTETFEHQAVFTLPVAVAADASAGTHPLTIRAAFQTCNQTTCLAPRSVDVEVEVTVASAAGPATPGPGAEVPNFSFTDFTGKARTFAEYRGRYVLLDFWASWCRPCLAELPHLKELYGKYHDRGFDILGMDSETLGQEDADPAFARETADRARAIVAARGAVWTHATAETAVPVATNIFGVESLPTKILVDREGRIVAHITDGAELDRTLARLFGEP